MSIGKKTYKPTGERKTKRRLPEGTREVVGTDDKPVIGSALEAAINSGKPSVNQVSQAFHDLHADVRKVMMNGPRGDMGYAQRQVDEAHAKLRETLAQWGIADLIDWERED